MMMGKVVYQDRKRKVTVANLRSEKNPDGAVKYCLCDNKRCRREAHYYVDGVVSGWMLHVCKKHMKTMNAGDVKDLKRRLMMNGVMSKVFSAAMRK
jgi:hypothetical protein